METSEPTIIDIIEPIKKKPIKRKAKILFFIGLTKYPVVKYVGRKILDYELTDNPEDSWDVMWTDSAITPDQFACLKLYQKVNHFPGMYSLARKNHLGRHLMRMREKFPDFYRFFPKTYLLPADYSSFRAQFLNKKQKIKTFIVKPEASCQGRGIYLTRSYENVDSMDHVVIQPYMERPFLIEGLKFDLRLYVLITGCDPLRIFLHQEGLARFATEEYQPPKGLNLDNLCMHLTNYAINKRNKNFVFNKDQTQASEGHKRSVSSVISLLKAKGHDTELLMWKIERFIVKTLCSVQPILAHNYSSCQPQSLRNDMCFELLGLDVLLDYKLTPFLLEVNHTPSFSTDSPLDKSIKRAVIKDSLQLLNLHKIHKARYIKQQKKEFENRAFGKPKVPLEEKDALVLKGRKARDIYEENNLGGFKKLFPLEKEEEPYQEFMDYAKVLWEKSTGTFKKQESVSSLKEKEVKKEALYKKAASSSSIKLPLEPALCKKKEEIKLITVKSPVTLRSRSHNSTKITRKPLILEKKPGELIKTIKKEAFLHKTSTTEGEGVFIRPKILEFGAGQALKTKEEYRKSFIKYYK